jgi:hypothetical protein
MKNICVLILSMFCSCWLYSQKSITVYPDSLDSSAKVIFDRSEMSIDEYLISRFAWNSEYVEGVRISATYEISINGKIVNLELQNIPNNCGKCVRDFVFELTSIPEIKPATRNGIPVKSTEAIIWDFVIIR